MGNKPFGLSRVGIFPVFAAVLIFGVNPASAEDPLSAIDWLSSSVATPAVPLTPTEPGIAENGGALPQNVIVSVLDGPSPDAAGVLAPSVTGLPRNLWGIGKTEEIAAALSAERADALPALQELLITLLLAEAAPPADAGGRGVLLLARIDKLLAIGALDQAAALIDAAGDMTPEIFRRSFDISMLTGTEDQACEHLGANPDLAPTYPARVFCLARAGD